MLYLAYTREDALFAAQLHEDLTALGLHIWLDLNEIPAGADWAAAQSAALQNAEGILLIVSPEALRREHIINEIEQIWDSDKPIYLAVAAPSPWEEWLAGLPYADFTTSFQDGLDSLLLLLTAGTDKRAGQYVDPAEAFLREAEGRAGEAEGTPPDSQQGTLRRTLRRLFGG